ncbi:MAG: Eco29kI family restriction endonuclease [Roseiflexaceae bacterium]|nr:Eco29kI family restriction endonuclease [Roseiflexaceae bacterium]
MKPFNPLDKKNLGISVTQALLSQSLHPLPPKQKFDGAGIYAIYYAGGYELYEPLRIRGDDDTETSPIYVGKAVPAGARMGRFGLDTPPGPVLFNRLKEHAESIKQTSDLNLEDFRCRFLVVDDIWIPLGETLLIEQFQPIWNSIVPGFGNHDPGKGRYNQQRSAWDTLHPGRPWAARLQDHPKTRDQITLEVRQALTSSGASRP